MAHAALHVTAPAADAVPAEPDPARATLRAGMRGALLTLFGILVSGPAAVVLVQALRPQPPWQGAESFARHLHPLQSLPYLGGFALLGGLVLLLTSLHARMPPAGRVRSLAALVLCAAFVALIVFNYVVQTSFVPALARPYDPANAALLAALSMANPASLAWALEMWGWGLLGVATWLVAPVFAGPGLERAARRTFVANGPLSVAGALWTMLAPGWMMTPAGLVAYALWNVLLCAMMVCAWLALRDALARRDS